MKKIIFLIVFTIGGWQHGLAQVATNGGSGLAATYTSLSGAITALNAATITSPVVITLTGNETSPAGGYNITATGTSTNTITIAGSSSTITAPSQTAGSLTDAIFKIVGGDFITIQGFTMQERSFTPASADITAGTNTMTEFGVALFYTTTDDGAQNCTIQNNTITLNRTYQNTFGIYSNSSHAAGSITVSATASSPAGSNSGLKVYGNTISNINHGILIIGATGAANFNTGIDIGGTASGTGNTISNFGTTGTFSGFLNVSTTVNGIVVCNSTGFNVSYNSITSSNGGISTAGTTLRGIFIPSASISPSGTFTNTINNNTIALTHGFTSGIIQGITVEATTGTATSTQNINNNNFTALRSAALATSGTITAISNSMANLANNCNGNTFTNISTNTTGSFTFFANVYSMPAGGSQTLNGNSIVTGFSKTGAGGTVTISTSGSSSPNGTFHTFTNNNFSNITVTSATGITGVTNGDGSSSSATRTVTGNTFNNWTGSSAIIGLSYAYIGGTTSSVSNNTLTNITGQGSLTGITIGPLASLATTLNVANNTISNLTGGSVTGLACTNASTTVNINGNTINTLSATAVASTTTALSIGGGATTNVFQNKIYNISGTHASSTVRGILISAGLNINIYNNLIGDLTAPAASGTDVIRGIIIASTTALSTHRIYGNTIYLNAASSGTNFGGSGIYHTVNATSTTSALDLQNNIIINGLTPKGTGLAVAFRRSAGAANNLANYVTTSDKNLFYAGTPGASNLIYSDGTSSAQTMADYKAGVFTAGTIAPRDANSFTEAWTSSNFESVTGSSANYLQPATTFITQAESGGNTIALTSPDYNNVVRPGLGGTSYDIGAWEFSGQGQTQGLTVTYDSQSGTAIANGSTTTGGSIATSPGTPTRTGYTFNGWFAASSGGSAISFPYTHGQTANFTLYAQWTATYMITVTAGAGGSISPGTGLVNAGSNNTYTITPDAGYLISDVTLDGTSATALTTGSYATGGTYVFTDVQTNHTISVTFALACTNVGLVSATATASPICANATTTLTYSGLTGTNASVTWTQNADGTGTTYGTGTPSSAVGPGTYYAYATGDCGSAISIAVTVATTPANAGADASTCGSPYSSYNLLYQNATASEGTVSWSSSGDGEFQYLTGSGPYTDLSPLYRIGPTDIINGSAIITLTVTAADNCVTTDSFTLTLVPPPTAIIDPIIVNPWDELLCTGGSYSFSNAVIAEGANIYWSRSGDGSFNNNSIQNPIYTPGPQDIADGYVYIDLNVTSYGETSCDNRVSVRLVIDPMIANAGADAIACGSSYSNYNLLYQNATASGGTVSWSSSGDGEFQYLTGSGPYTDLSPLYRIGSADIINGSAIITLTVTGDDNSVTTDSFILTLVPPPTAIIDPIIVNPWDELHVCAGGSYSFSNAVIAEGANIYWYRSGDGSFNNNSIQNPIYTPGPQDIADGYVYIDLNVTSYGETSCDNRVSVRLVIDPIFAITASAGTNGSISSTGVTSMSCDGTEDKTYAITPDTGYSISDVTVDGTSATALTTGSYALGGTYVFTDVQVNHTISVTFALACSNVGLASATATASPICANATTTLTYSGLTGTNASVTWTQNADGTGTTYGTGTPSSAVGPGTYYAYATGDCGSAVSIPVTVGSKVTVGLASATATASPICANATTTLTYSGLTGTNASVTWTQNADGTGTTYGTGTPSSAVGPGTYYAYASGDCGTAVSIAVTVATTPKTNPTFTEVSAICSGATMVALLTTSVNEIEGTWSPELNNLETTEYTFTPIEGQCANTATMTITVTPATTNGSVTTSICAGDSYTWPLPNGTGLTYASAQTGLTNVVGCNTATLNLTITAQLQWYLDADSDGYYTGAAVTSCTSPGAGYTTTVMGGGDCNDANSAIHPGVQPTEPTKVNCWDNFVFNTGTCSWDNTGTQATEPTKVNSWDTFVFNIGTCSWDNTGTPTNSTTILDSQCGSTLATLNSTITAYPVANATLYTFKIVTSGTNAIRYYRSTTSSFNLTQVKGSLYNTTYTLSVAATIGGSLKAYGSACTVTTPAVPLSKVQDSQCGINLTALSTVIVPFAVPLAQGYKYKVTNTVTNEVNYYTRSATATFALSHRPDTNSGSVAIKLSSTYSVAVAVKHNGVFSDYGDACLVSTPLLPTTKIQDALCDTTLANINSYLYLKAQVAGQKGYRFKVTQGAEERTYDRPSGSYPFQLKQLVGGAAYATTYEVAVSVFYNGAWQPYGATCTVTTPAALQSKLATTQCGITLNKTNTNVLTANYVGVAQAYSFEVSKGASAYTVETASGLLRTFKLTEVPGLTLESGATYGIRVAIKANGTWQPYGTSCNVTTYGSPAIVKMADPLAKPESVFNALAYPNPFSSAFQLELNTSSKAAVDLKVYDVLGRLIENRQWNAAEASEQEMGNNYPSGVYNIILNQGENVKTLRVIKR